MEHPIDTPYPGGATADTICAVSTAPGRGGIAVIRISGPEAIEATGKIWRGKALHLAQSHTAHLGEIVDPACGDQVDQAVATIFRAPRSYTGDDVVELAVHGSPYIQSQVLKHLCTAGCRIAEPGEFTRRAFQNGRLDLPRAEAVADIIAASSAAAHRLAVAQLNGHFSSRIQALHDSLLQLASLLELELDFSEEDVTFADRSRLSALAQHTLAEVSSLAATFDTGDALRRGIPVAIVGQPNAGKSSLLNALLGTDRAIVSDIPGTTRDTIEESTDIDGLTFRFVDTAGLRDTSDTIESLGIDRALQRAAQARLILWLIPADHSEQLTRDIHRSLAERLPRGAKLIPCLTKADLSPLPSTERLINALTGSDPIHLSVKQPQTIANLRTILADTTRADLRDSGGLVVTNARHYQALTQAAEALQRVTEGLDSGRYTDLVAQDLREALHHLATITGSITTDTLLQSIFSTFCVGK